MRGRSALQAASAAGDRTDRRADCPRIARDGVTVQTAKFTARLARAWRNRCDRSFDAVDGESCAEANLLIKEGAWLSPDPGLHDRRRRHAKAAFAPASRVYPGHLPEALLCGATCAELGPIMRGEKEAVQVLFTGGGRGIARSILRRRPRHQSVARRHRPPPWRKSHAIFPKDADCAFSRSAPAPVDWPRKCCRCSSAACTRYVFSDVSAAFFPAARQKLAAFPEVEFKALRSRKAGTCAGVRSGRLRPHHRHQRRACGQRRARRAAQHPRPARAGRKPVVRRCRRLRICG